METKDETALRQIAELKARFARGEIADKQRELRDWLDAHPEVGEEARRGFEGIEAGKFTRVSRRKSA